MRTGSSIPQLAKLARRSLGRQNSDTQSTQSARLEPLDTIGEDDLEALADEVIIVQCGHTSSTCAYTYGKRDGYLSIMCKSWIKDTRSGLTLVIFLVFYRCAIICHGDLKCVGTWQASDPEHRTVS